MKNKFNLLILTDHSNHSVENSLYAFVQAMKKHPACNRLDIATRGITDNASFFNGTQSEFVYTITPDDEFIFDQTGINFTRDVKKEVIHTYDFIWLRLPPPLSAEFLEFLDLHFKNQVIINAPSGIYDTGSKAFLMNFQELCPPMKICKTIEDIKEFKSQFPIVLKPFREYGGRGIVRIENDNVWIGKKETTFDNFTKELSGELNYLGVKFLKNVSLGDKRIVVVNGQIMGASLRLPAKDSWLCNVAMGGSSNLTKVEEEEIKIVEEINPILAKMGIIMYGVDTLVGDDGKRKLSEINTTSIGGLPQIARLKNEPLIEKAADLIWKSFIKKFNYVK